jgi:hypothetical protein
MQPSEMDALEPWELVKWVDLAAEQIQQQNQEAG